MKTLQSLLRLFILALVGFALPVWGAETSKSTLDLSGDWVYGGSEGRAEIKQSQGRVTMELTWTPNSDPSPHYEVQTSISGRSLTGTWRCVTRVCVGQQGLFHAEISAGGNRLVVSKTEDPNGTNGWNGLVFERAPKNATAMKKALQESGTVEIYDILFDVDQTVIKPESKPILDELANLLRNDLTLKLEVSGHTDNTGSAKHNLILSKGRADAVVKKLETTYGIAKQRLLPKGYGDTMPVAPNDTDRNRASNRRVELRKI